MPKSAKPASDELRREYDFSQAVRGRHYHAYGEGTNVVLLEPDVAAVFPDSAAVNRALRRLLKSSRLAQRPSRS